MPHIVVLEHESGHFEDTQYVLKGIVDVWREQGIEVTALQGKKTFVPADLAVLHVDLTVVPEDYLVFLRRYPKVLNLRVTDISKRRFSTLLVDREDDWNGPVIVKTNRNFAGKPEARLEARCGRWQRMLKRLTSSRGPDPQRLAASGYLVLEAKQEVPADIWDNPHLVVEQFRPERKGDLYGARSWVFLGNRECAILRYATGPIVKSRNTVERAELSDIPEELRRRREELGFDYGKFDFAVSDGEVYLYDINRTPNFGHVTLEKIRSNLEHLAPGIHSFLP